MTWSTGRIQQCTFPMWVERNHRENLSWALQCISLTCKTDLKSALLKEVSKPVPLFLCSLIKNGPGSNLPFAHMSKISVYFCNFCDYEEKLLHSVNDTVSSLWNCRWQGTRNTESVTQVCQVALLSQWNCHFLKSVPPLLHIRYNKRKSFWRANKE